MERLRPLSPLLERRIPRPLPACRVDVAPRAEVAARVESQAALVSTAEGKARSAHVAAVKTQQWEGSWMSTIYVWRILHRPLLSTSRRLVFPSLLLLRSLR
jgi:hypothetical protein